MHNMVTIGYSKNSNSHFESDQVSIDLGSLSSIEEGQAVFADILDRFRDLIEAHYNMLIEESLQ